MARFEDTFAPYVPFGSRTLRLSIPPLAGTDVAVLQAVYDLMLTVMSSGPAGPPVPITGIYDAATAQAVRRIQAYFGLAVDGVAGPDTYFVFGQGVGPHVTYGGPVYGSRSLSEGMSGGDVRILQNRLAMFAPYAQLLGGPPNGVFGPSTAAAVRAFKKDAISNGDTGLPDNAVVGSGAFDATWIYTFAGGRGLLAGSGRNGYDVAFLQVLLGRLGLYTGPVDGIYGPTTVAAVVAFQRSQGIVADGNVGPVTFYRLGLQNPNSAPGPLGIAWPTAMPQVSVCSVPLRSATSDLHPYGVASIVVNLAEGFESLDVVANLLPDPSSFGSAYGQYAFTLTQPGTGTVFGQGLLTLLPGGTQDWGGSLSVGVATIPKAMAPLGPLTTGATLTPSGYPAEAIWDTRP
jgi:peptidoglycan hydrolase-like protein with peptidoglycan-binding domain